jgi:hypothetical protein
MRRRLACLRGEVATFPGDCAVIGQQHPAARGGHYLVAVEGEHSGRAE